MAIEVLYVNSLKASKRTPLGKIMNMGIRFERSSRSIRIILSKAMDERAYNSEFYQIFNYSHVRSIKMPISARNNLITGLRFSRLILET